VLLYASNNFQAQINSLESFPSDSDCQAVTVSSTNFKFNLITAYNENDQQGVHGRTIERILLSKQLPADCLVLCNFNTHDLWWDPLCPSTSSGAAAFIHWIENHELELLKTPGVGTFFRPKMSRESVLDVFFASRSLAGKVQDWQVISGLESDYHRLLFAIKASDTQQSALLPRSSRFNTNLANWDIFKATLQSTIENSNILSTLDTSPVPTPELSKSLLMSSNPELKDRLDNLRKALTSAIEEGTRAAMPFVKQRPKSKPWWNSDLSSLWTDMLHKQRRFIKELARASREEFFLWKKDYLLARNAYFQAIKAAK
jgi:hypothetical protein